MSILYIYIYISKERIEPPKKLTEEQRVERDKRRALKRKERKERKEEKKKKIHKVKSMAIASRPRIFHIGGPLKPNRGMFFLFIFFFF
jgi:hypothetical protein